jgi:hypothetical protein
MKHAGRFESGEYDLRVVTTLYLGRISPPKVARRLVVVVFSIRGKGVERYVAYGVDPDNKQVLFWLVFLPEQLRAVLKTLIDNVRSVIDCFDRLMTNRPRGGELQLVEGAVNTLRVIERKVGPAGKGASTARRAPKAAHAFDDPPPPPHEQNTIVVPGTPPTDTGPKIALALGGAVTSDADLTDAASEAA